MPQQNPNKLTQSQQPGIEQDMSPEPQYSRSDYQGNEKLIDQTALVTGGDSGIGRSVSLHFAKEGADVAIVYLNEHEDAQETKRLIEQEGRSCLLIDGDIGRPTFCESAVTETIDHFGKLDVLVNNAAEQHPQDNFLDITNEQLEQTFKTNVFGTFYMTKADLPTSKQVHPLLIQLLLQHTREVTIWLITQPAKGPSLLLPVPSLDRLFPKIYG